MNHLEEPALIHEGQCDFYVPSGPFFNQKAKISRDFGVLGIRAEAQLQNRPLRVIDMMCGIGTRGIRYACESPVDELLMADGNAVVVSAAEQNLQRNANKGHAKVSFIQEQLHQLAFKLRVERELFDWVDIDVFGSPAPYWHAATLLNSFGSILYLTATDTAALWGKYAESAFRHYGAMTRNWDCGDEIGIRCLLASLQQSAGEREFYITPLFCLDEGYAFRIAVRLHYGIEKYPMKHMGWITKCQQCSTIKSSSFRDIPSLCSHCGGPLQTAGPAWIGPLHDLDFITRMRSLTDEKEFKQACKTLDLMIAECNGSVGYYSMGTIGRLAHLLGIPAQKKLVDVLQQLGYTAMRTHLEPQAIKTNAPLPEVLEIVKQL